VTAGTLNFLGFTHVWGTIRCSTARTRSLQDPWWRRTLDGHRLLTETCRLNDVDPLAYLTDVLTRIVKGHPNRDVDQLLPWAYRTQSLKAVP
jgi:IS66 C-terminal element